MTSPIKPPSGPPIAFGPVDAPVAGPARVAESTGGEDFRASLQGADAPDGAAPGGEARSESTQAAGAQATRAQAADLAAALRSGSVTPAAALDALVSQALASADAQRLEPAGRAALEQHLRTMLAEDPSLQELVSDLSRT
jgi:hypothetical protein